MTRLTTNLADHRRVAVTGMGCLTPAGEGADSLWDGILKRQSTIRADDTDPSPYRCRWAAPVERSLWDRPLPAGGRAASGDPAAAMAVLAADQALHQAGWQDNAAWGRDVGVVLGTGAGPTHALHDAYKMFESSAGRRMRPTTVPRCMANSLSAQVAIGYRLTGPNYVIVSACASATVAIGTAYRMIRCGICDRMICGGVETVLDPVSRSAWDRLGVLTRSASREDAVRPFDRRRDGFVLGEGAGVLVLEALETARDRNARVLGEVAGYGESSDATHMTQPDSEGQRRAMQRALDDAGIAPTAIDLIVAHGTATQANDRAEAVALHRLFGNAIDTTPVLALKPLWGHTLGASGAIESIACLMALENQCIPPDPLFNREPDPDARLRFAPPAAQPAVLNYAIKNSFAFGGNNAVLIFRASRPATTPIQETSHAPSINP